jgi:hypothetical protein
MKEYMKKTTQSGKELNLDPFEVFIEMRRRGYRQIFYVKKFGVSRAAVTYAFQGRSKPLLRKIAKNLNMKF